MPVILKKIIQTLLERPDLIITIYNVISQLAGSTEDKHDGDKKEKG